MVGKIIAHIKLCEFSLYTAVDLKSLGFKQLENFQFL